MPGHWSSVRFTSATTGYVTGSSMQGTILRTTDGGQTWQPFSDRLGTIFDLSFPGHGLVGYAQSGNGVLKTQDGGDTWSVLPFGGGGNVIACPDAQTVLAVGGGEVARSDDGGQTWTRTRIVPLYNSTNLVSLTMADSRNGYVSGDRNGLDQLFARTTDGGRTWDNITSSTSTGLRHLTFPTVQIGFAVRFSELYTTRDAGQTWQQVTSLQHYNGVKDVYFVDVQVGYVIDDAGYLHKTTDGGTSWQSTHLLKGHSSSDNHPERVRFRDREVGCVQDDNGGIYRTSDGGQTWIAEINMGSRAMDYTFSGNALVLGGYNGMLVRRSLTSNPLPFEAKMLPPVALTDSSAVLAATVRTTNCYLDSLHMEYVPAATPDFSKAQVALAYPITWFTDSIQSWVPRGLLPATTYRARLRLLHNGTRYYSDEKEFTTPARTTLPPPELVAYPNPTTGFLRVAKLEGAPAQSIEVYSLQGALLRHASGRGIDMSSLPSGLYILRVQAGEQVYRRRIQKL